MFTLSRQKISFKYVILEVKLKITKFVGGNIFEITPSVAHHNSLTIRLINRKNNFLKPFQMIFFVSLFTRTRFHHGKSSCSYRTFGKYNEVESTYQIYCIFATEPPEIYGGADLEICQKRLLPIIILSFDL